MIGGAKEIICHYRSSGRYEASLPLSDARTVIEGQVSALGDLYAVQWLSSNYTKVVSSVLRPCFRDTSPPRPTHFEPTFGPNRVRKKYKSPTPPAEGERQGYVSSIKQRFSSKPEVYRRFLDILNTYERGELGIREVWQEINLLFHDQPDLVKE